MITVGIIRNGEGYLKRHLRKNDYWAEGEKEVEGEWIGEGAKALGLEGAVTSKAFEALRTNKHPRTGERLAARGGERSVAFFDVQLSAPKDVSVLALVGADERVVTAFHESAKAALAEMERFAAVRERTGRSNGTEDFRITQNYAGALFLHDSSRDLDPQLHVHAVLANVTWDPEKQKWMALQPVEMLRASVYVRQAFYRELAGRLHELGYETYDMDTQGFAIRGVEHLRDRFSKRARQVRELAEEFAARNGRKPTKREVEVLVRSSRQDKLTEITTDEVRARQHAQLSPDEQREISELVAGARARPTQLKPSHGDPQQVLAAGLRHVYERTSVAREASVLAAALELHPDFYRWRDLVQALDSNPEVIRAHAEMTLRPVAKEEDAVIRRFKKGRFTRIGWGDPTTLPDSLTHGQRRAAKEILDNHDTLTVLIGDAGTGKTTVLSAIQTAHIAWQGDPFIPLAPTSRAAEGLAKSGFKDAVTVQRFLVDEELQQQSIRRHLLIDEAGLLSTQQMDAVTRIAAETGARILFVGDPKQHYSVRRGDALRNLIRDTDLPVVRLSEVLRQRSEADRTFSMQMASGNAFDGFQGAYSRGLVEEVPDESKLFEHAAEHYASNLKQGIDTLVVIPFWEEIERFSTHARSALRRAGLLGEQEVSRDSVAPLNWTEEQKAHWHRYREGDRLVFTRKTRFYKRGTSAVVMRILSNGLVVHLDDGRDVKITRRQRDTFDVGRVRRRAVSAGDRLLLRSADKENDYDNGDVVQVSHVDPEKNEVVLSDGKKLDPGFHAWTYAHAMTSYRAQGSTAEESIVVLGPVAERALLPRQFYVANTRFRGTHKIYVANRKAISSSLARRDFGRELAGEFLGRHHLTYADRIAIRPYLRYGRHAWHILCAFREQALQMSKKIKQQLHV